jgi:hypothetical protein
MPEQRSARAAQLAIHVPRNRRPYRQVRIDSKGFRVHPRAFRSVLLRRFIPRGVLENLRGTSRDLVAALPRFCARSIVSKQSYCAK